MSIWFYIAIGFVLGTTFQRIAIALMIGKIPDSICDYCKWRNRKK